MPTRLRILGVHIPEAISHRHVALPLSAVLVALLALIEWVWQADFSLGILYTIPIAIAGLALDRVEIFLLAIVCAFVRGMYTPGTPLEYWMRFAMATIAFSGIGLFVVEMSRNRRAVLSYYANLKLEQELRRQAEEQLRILAESSPAAILTVNHEGVIVAANRSASETFGLSERESLAGRPVGAFVEALGNALKLPSGAREVRASAWTWARRLDGATFPIAAWFSTYGRGEARYLAAIVVDVSEEVRDRERENFRHLLGYNRLLAGAVSHEIRNLCSAAAVVSSGLARRPGLAEDPDFQALVQLVGGLGRMASFELSHRKEGESGPLAASVAAVLDQLRIIIEPDWQEEEGELRIEVDPGLPEVRADAHALLQILLNLAQNSLRAVQESPEKRLAIHAVEIEAGVVVSVIDSGPGIADPARLFQPFRPGADGTGLGLYISRTLARSFDGELRHVPRPSGCRFDVTLKVARKHIHV